MTSQTVHVATKARVVKMKMCSLTPVDGIISHAHCCGVPVLRILQVTWLRPCGELALRSAGLRQLKHWNLVSKFENIQPKLTMSVCQSVSHFRPSGPPEPLIFLVATWELLYFLWAS